MTMNHVVNHDAGEFLSEEISKGLREQRLFTSRTLFMSEAVTSSTAKKLVTDLILLDEINQDPIKLYINSPGGEVTSGFAIFDTIRFIRSQVKVINTGLCASIATIINVAAKKENRFAMPNARFLIHQPLIHGWVQGPASDIEITANEIVKTREKLNRILAEECGQKLEKISEDTLRDYWMTSAEALEYGLISKVVTSRKDVG